VAKYKSAEHEAPGPEILTLTYWSISSANILLCSGTVFHKKLCKHCQLSLKDNFMVIQREPQQTCHFVFDYSPGISLHFLQVETLHLLNGIMTS